MKPKPPKNILRKYLSGVSLLRLDSIKRMAKPLEGKRVVVHLGNVDDTGCALPLDSINKAVNKAAKTRDYAKRFREFNFIGIDSQELLSSEDNWVQVQADFKKGLKRFQDNSLDVISSEMALGYYGSKFKGTETSKKGNYQLHTIFTIRTAYKKLKFGGSLDLAVGSDVLATIKVALRIAGFKKKNIKIREIGEKERKGRTAWLFLYGYCGKKLYQIEAKK